MKIKAFHIGLTLIIISFIACVIEPYFLTFGMPAFIVSAIIILFSNTNIKTKLFTILTPIFLYVPTMFLFLYFYNYSTPKTILIPKHVNGNLRIVYEEECGGSYGIENGVETLIFPENGILVLKEDFDRHNKYNCYLIDKLGNRTKIPNVIAFADSLPKRPYLQLNGSGKMYWPIKIDSVNQQQKAVKVSDFYVYNTDGNDLNDYNMQQKFDSLTLAIVKQCRVQGDKAN